MRRTVLLDLDGTLVDSAAGIARHLDAALAEVGGPRLDEATLRSCVGPPFETALPALGLTAEQTAAAIAAYRHSYNEVAAELSPPYPGVPALLDRLRAAGLRLALATSKPEYLARDVVRGTGLDRRLDAVGGADHLAGRVGKAAVVGELLERLHLDPRSDPVLMVGDRHHDVEGAGAHGVRTVGVGWGYAEPGELAGSVLVVDDLDGLADALLGDMVWCGDGAPPP